MPLHMNRRTFLKASAATAAMSLVSSIGSAAEGAQRQRPNILWLLGDQHRAQALSCAGDPNLSTPNLDKMASDGRHFTAALSGFPLCCPFRGSMITGRYPHVCVPGHEYPLPPGSHSIVEPLHAVSYHCAYFGKWHLDGWHEADGRAAMHIVPPERRCGFDEWIGYENNNAQYDCWVHGGKGDGAFHYKLPGYETDELTNLLIKHLKSRAEAAKTGDARPFFAVLSVQPPHNPYVAPPAYMDRHKPDQIRFRPNVPAVPSVRQRARRQLAGAYAQIENLDWNVGRVFQTLKELGLADNTYVLFFSDHGDMHGSHGQYLKMTAYDEAIRIPFMIWGGAALRPVKSGKDPALLNHVDIAPTTLGLAGVAKPQWMQGTDYSPHVLEAREPADDPDSAYLQSVIPTMHGDSVDRPWRGIVTRDGWKYVCLERQPWLLFNLTDDPYEQVNLAYNTRFSAQRKKLRERLAAWIEKTADKFPLPST